MQNFFDDQLKKNRCGLDCGTDSGAMYYAGVLCQEKLDAEEQASDILTLYKQLKLQQALKQDTALLKEQKQSLLYTNERLIQDIGNQIEQSETDYPKSYQSVAKSEINNTILTALQLRTKMLQTDPLQARPQ